MILGLTGGIASGKSTVAQIFKELGASVIDADLISRTLLEPGGAAEEGVRKRFGTLDRKSLRELVFKDPRARKDLEKILHPLIQSESKKQMAAIIREKGPDALILYEAALLVETGRAKDFNGLLVVEAPEPTRIARLMARDGISHELAQQMIASQASDADRRSAASHLILNTGDLAELRAQVEALMRSRFTKN